LSIGKGQFLQISKAFIKKELFAGIEVTGDPAFSMFNLSLKDDWVNSKTFCNRLAEEEPLDKEGKQVPTSLKAIA
jgi:hypothetical protein